MLLRSVVTVTSLVITYMARMWLHPLRDNAQLSKCHATLLWWLLYGWESSNVGGLLRQELGPISQREHELMIQNYEHYLYSNLYSNDTATSQICTCHNSRTVVACAKLWPDFIIVCYASATWIAFKRIDWWVHKYLVGWIPGLLPYHCNITMSLRNTLIVHAK